MATHVTGEGIRALRPFGLALAFVTSAATLVFGCASGLGAMRPADVLGAGETHLGWAMGVSAPVPSRSTPRSGDTRAEGAAAARQIARPAGFGQEVQLRHGVGGNWEVGERIGPSTLGLDGRWQVLGERKWLATLGAGVAMEVLPSLPLMGEERFDLESARRFDMHAEMLAGRNWGDVLRVWIGPRVGASRFELTGEVGEAGEAVEASGLVGFVGCAAGIAAGYRWIAAAAEIAPAWVFSDSELNGEPLGLKGLVLQPSFGIFLRF